VAAWSPLADGILSGKFTAATAAEPGTRVDAAGLSDRQREIATLVRDVAADIGATPAQVAIAWTMMRSPAIHPIIGARRLDQLRDNLGAADLELPADALGRLDAATEPDLGFPASFIRDTSPWVFGAADLPRTGRPPRS
jgi:aryl-alcohol dehydrogenase-like predicted oxidoreductase